MIVVQRYTTAVQICTDVHYNCADMHRCTLQLRRYAQMYTIAVKIYTIAVQMNTMSTQVYILAIVRRNKIGTEFYSTWILFLFMNRNNFLRPNFLEKKGTSRFRRILQIKEQAGPSSSIAGV